MTPGATTVAMPLALVHRQWPDPQPGHCIFLEDPKRK